MRFVTRVLTRSLPFQQIVAGRTGCSCDTASCRPVPAVLGPRRRNRGSSTVLRVLSRMSGMSREVLLAGPAGPRGEVLVRAPAVLEATQNPLQVFGQVLRGGLQAPDLAAEPGALPVTTSQGAPQVDLESLRLVPVGTDDQ